MPLPKMYHSLMIVTLFWMIGVSIANNDEGASLTSLIWNDNECSSEPGSRHSVKCTGLLSPQRLAQVSSLTSHLTVVHSNLTELRPEHLQHLVRLKSLRISNSFVSLSPTLWPPSQLHHITFSHCWSMVPSASSPRLTPHLKISPEIWSQLDKLEKVEFLDNNLTVTEEGGPGVGGFAKLPKGCMLVIRGGQFDCKANHVYLYDMVNEGRANVTYSTQCFISGDISKFDVYFTINSKPVLLVLGFRKTTEQCPKSCKCVLVGLRSTNRPLISVNCSSLGLTELPQEIPPLTSSLIMANNRLTSLEVLFNHPNYKRVANCDFSDNSISVINASALLNFLLTHRSYDIKLNLRNNNLNTFPVAELSSLYSLGRRNGVKFLPLFDLSGNPWDCDNCSFSVPFKDFIYQNMFSIHDHTNVRCFQTGELVLQVDLAEQCSPPPWLLLDIDIINIVLAVCLIMVIADFLYNCYQYRRHGTLPWVVRNCKAC